MNTRDNVSTPKSSQKKHQGGRKTIDVLPDPEILEAYDYIVEGSAQQIMDMFVREQKHRHEWELKALRTHHLSTVLGQWLGFFICVSVFVSASVIGVFGNQVLAATVWIFGLSIIVMAGIVWMYAKHMGQRPLFGRPQLRTHFRPVKDQHNPVESGAQE
ncbi:MAG: DUF2335 domain-containing protein [Alphaproteobacteria bacterium]|nr:MAG: DUF2335 domain-containing protein [Alphaproteobacteria bacterium]TAF15920.1 MAG: DUF2335 domain-containing protein [Alphaproteobacteria bacterium]TAF38976.1 MAG: DUF2335 domain-containing protein [Alphaproteobacteria bacterium]TAF76734.1 MAG: DUF2335 domain-containing protein [Alphaproteobacteria bacterium]